MENLEILTDQQLKTKLMEFGFANLPITDTTRKVLMKKLKNAIDTQKVKSRRETIAVAKFSSDEEVESAAAKPRAKTPVNRRATIAIAAIEKTSTKKVNGAALTNGGSDTPPKSATTSRTPSRRTSRATPAKQLQEESDEDDLPLISQVTRRSASRTVTPTILGISETVRTTYNNINPVNEEAEIQFETEEISEPVETKTTRRKTITTSSSNIPDRSTPTNFRRTTITTSYNPSGAKNIDKDEQDVVEINEATTPYLSNFAKRLSTLKAEPLDIGMQKYRSETSTSNYPRSSLAATSSGTGSQYVYKKPQGGIMRDLTRTFESLEKRYRFCTTLYVVGIVLIIIAIYVLFFT